MKYLKNLISSIRLLLGEYGFILILIITMLIIGVIVSKKFEKIANMKGHQGYFWWCFWLGIAGWAMVIALPDRSIGTMHNVSTKDELPDL